MNDSKVETEDKVTNNEDMTSTEEEVNPLDLIREIVNDVLAEGREKENKENKDKEKKDKEGELTELQKRVISLENDLTSERAKSIVSSVSKELNANPTLLNYYIKSLKLSLGKGGLLLEDGTSLSDHLESFLGTDEGQNFLVSNPVSPLGSSFSQPKGNVINTNESPYAAIFKALN